MSSKVRSTILVVDDTEANVDILVEILSDTYDVAVAMEGPTALEIAAEELPDLVLLDVMMPDMDGWEVCAKLKESLVTRDIPVIFVTAKTQAEDEIRGFEMGAVDFVTKPISPPVVLQRIRSTLALKEHRDRLAALSANLGRYLSPQLYESIFKGEQRAEVGARRKKLTVFFSDIVDFTATTERLAPEDMTSLLNSYLDRMASIANKHGGTVDKFIGDAILIFFGDPVTRGEREDALACVEMALDMREAIHQLQKEWYDKGVARPFKVRIGINTGYCTVGNFGSKDRLTYTILGSSVNIAARLEQNAAPDQILISHETWGLVKDSFNCLGRQPIYGKGVAHPIDTYQVLDRKKLLNNLPADGIHQLSQASLILDISTTLDIAVAALDGTDTGECLVILQGTTPAGIITKGAVDLYLRTARTEDLASTSLTTLMNKAPLFLDASATIAEATKAMLQQEGNARVEPAIITQDGNYVGVLHSRSLMRLLFERTIP